MYLLSDQDDVFVNKLVGGHFEIEGGGSLADAAGNVVVGPVAGAKPAAKVAGVTGRDAAEMGTNAQHDHELGLDVPVAVLFLVAQHAHRDGLFVFNFLGRAVANKDGFAPPFDRDGLADGDFRQVEFTKRQRQDFRRRAHGGHKLDDEQAGGRGVGKAHGREHQIRKGPTLGFGHLVDPIIFKAVVDGTELVEGLSAPRTAGGQGLAGGQATKQNRRCLEDCIYVNKSNNPCERSELDCIGNRK
jgi:hypothetical protein